jgi:hypothetical protein
VWWLLTCLMRARLCTVLQQPKRATFLGGSGASLAFYAVSLHIAPCSGVLIVLLLLLAAAAGTPRSLVSWQQQSRSTSWSTHSRCVLRCFASSKRCVCVYPLCREVYICGSQLAAVLVLDGDWAAALPGGSRQQVHFVQW